MDRDRDIRHLESALAAAGYGPDLVGDFARTGVSYQSAIPVLLAELDHVRDWRVADQIVRSLSVPWARPAAIQPLIDLFERTDDGGELGLRWTIGNALEVLWDDTYFDGLSRLALDAHYGRAREMIVLGLAKSRDPRAILVLLRLAQDPSVNGHAVSALRKLRAPEARGVFEEALLDKRAWVRREGKKGLARLDAAGGDARRDR